MKNIDAASVTYDPSRMPCGNKPVITTGKFVRAEATDGAIDSANHDSRLAGVESVNTSAAPQAGPQWLSGQFSHSTGVHNFKVYIPATYHGGPTPLIVMLHGAGQDADDFAIGTGMNSAADIVGHIVVYPEQASSANMLRCWNWFRPADQVRESGEASIIAGITREVMATYNIDPTRVFIAGMSAGAAMAVNLAVTHPDLYAAAGIHSGLAFGVADEPFSAMGAMSTGTFAMRLPAARDTTGALHAVPLIVFHGDQDSTVHPRNAEMLMQMNQCLILGADDAHPLITAELGQVERGHAYTRNTFRRDSGEIIGEQWLIHGLGHAWSGGNADGTHTDVRGPHAAREMVRFFEAVADAR